MNKEILKEVKFYIGPMSKNIVDTIVKFSIDNKYYIGLIPSRRQIDYNNGYVNNWNTSAFRKYLVSDYIITERDHGGIGQGEKYDNGLSSFYHDSNYLDILHIDPWKVYSDMNKGLIETIDIIKFIHEINKECLFEIGTEEAIRYFSVDDIYRLLRTLKDELGQLFDNIVYCVIQSGTRLRGTTNTGVFDPKRLKDMVSICNEFGVLSKEHNGDYLSKDDIKRRFDIGLSAINIAPEFGVFETDIILENMTNEQKEIFFNICYDSKKWVKWVDSNFNPLENKTELMRICGHYQFSTDEFKKMNLDLDNIIKEKLYNKLKIMKDIW